MLFNPFNLFILSASIHGLLFGIVVLFSKKFNAKPNKYLAYYILLVSLNNVYFWFLDTNIVSHYNWDYYWLFPIQWDLLMFPAFYYFIISYLGSKKIPRYYMYPFYISFPFCLFFLLQQVYWKDSINIDTVWIQGFYNVLSYISILCTAFAIYKGYKKIVTYKNSGHSLSSIRIGVLWLKRLLLLAMAVFFIWVLITIYNNFIDGDIETERITTYILWISMSLLIYWMGYQGIYHLGIFNQRKKIRENLSHLKVGCNGNGFNKGKNRYEDIDRTIRKDKLYIDPSISLSSVAECFELSEGYLSRLINKNTGLNFPNYINNLRVNEAQRLLKDPSYQNYTIVAIGLESGFNSRSAFYSSFKNHTGVIPSEYRKQANVS